MHFFLTSLCSHCQDLRSQAPPWNPVSFPHIPPKPWPTSWISPRLNSLQSEQSFSLEIGWRSNINWLHWSYTENASYQLRRGSPRSELSHLHSTLWRICSNLLSYYVAKSESELWPKPQDYVLHTIAWQVSLGVRLIRSLWWEDMQTTKNTRNRPYRYLWLFIKWSLNFVCFTYICNLLCSVW